MDKTNYALKEKPEPAANDKFLTGLVFGFDVGTGSIGYADFPDTQLSTFNNQPAQ
jgi:hypothetical protein